MTYAYELVSGRFDSAESYAQNAIEEAKNYTDQLETLLQELEVPSIEALENIETPEITPIDYSARPKFSAVLESFPAFDNIFPSSPVLETVPGISVSVPSEDVSFTEINYSAPVISIKNAPTDNTNIESVEIPDKPEMVFPAAPKLTDIAIPDPPNITLPVFEAVLSPLETLSTPTNFQYYEGAYNSDIRVALFAKILTDIENGGTGLSVEVEADIYARGTERQRVENERLYREVENQFSATGMHLPSGAFAARLLEVSNEISRKNDQLNREIIINQAELAQKNTQFTVEQARQIEASLMDFFQRQQDRLFEAAKSVALQSIEVFKALVSKEKLKLEQYQAEAAVFETKIRAELTAVEIYKAQMEGVRVSADVQQSLVNIYGTEVKALETIISLYATEMESTKVKVELQQLKIDLFKAQTDVYVAGLEAEKIKADIYGSQVESERNRAEAYGERVKAYQTKVEAKKTEVEIKKSVAANVLQKNQQKIDEYLAKIDGYKAELLTETQTSDIQIRAFESEATAYTAEIRAQEMQYSTQISEINAFIEKAKLDVSKGVAIIDAVKSGYVALKELQTKGTEGIMNAHAQVAASAMNSVNASASMGYSSSDSDSATISETHYYEEKKL
ncbi:hypothetical protein [Desulfobacter postgatei]|uniref:hypothetical protein n=1 Tax=Desulfobacter postgatei TaxID=2293 RepID=UPI00259B1D11|nr:hypothetical protein [uncultured Desulfobacter sp.]